MKVTVRRGAQGTRRYDWKSTGMTDELFYYITGFVTAALMMLAMFKAVL